jgi:signal transduction histidine kinase
MAKDLDESVDKLEAAVDPNTVISIGGYNFTPAKLMVAGAIVSSTLGGLYGVFEVYKDYMSMKEAIQTYVTPDLGEINKKIAVLEQNSEKSTEYVRDINQTLRGDIRRLENVVDSVERSTKQSQRETDISVKEAQSEVRQAVKEVQAELRQIRKETEIAIKDTNANLDKKIQRALDNPLANK